MIDASDGRKARARQAKASTTTLYYDNVSIPSPFFHSCCATHARKGEQDSQRSLDDQNIIIICEGLSLYLLALD